MFFSTPAKNSENKNQTEMKATVCTALKLNCSVCKRRVRDLNESLIHSMQWPEDLLAKVWELVRMDMWRAKMKERLWKDLHDEMNQEWREWQWKYLCYILPRQPQPRNPYKSLFWKKESLPTSGNPRQNVYVVVSNYDWWFTGTEYNPLSVHGPNQWVPSLPTGYSKNHVRCLGPVDEVGRSAWYAFETTQWGGYCEI
jgi:hypothetical protein